jgi:membrane-bound metal-dependent hydrolase YbcI (DUF457 family)
MASPVAHSFAGVWTFLLFAGQSKLRLLGHRYSSLLAISVLVFVANMPDLDFFLSLAFRGNLNELHRGFTHSILAAVLVAIALACFWRIARTFWLSAAVFFVAYCSHLLIDLCTGSKLGWTNSGSGIPLFWPSAKEYSSPLILVLGVLHQDLPAVWSMENAVSCLYELVLCGGITAVVLVMWARYAQNNPRRLLSTAHFAKRVGRGRVVNTNVDLT